MYDLWVTLVVDKNKELVRKRDLSAPGLKGHLPHNSSYQWLFKITVLACKKYAPLTGTIFISYPWITPKNDRYLISPQIIIAELKIKVIRMKEIIAN